MNKREVLELKRRFKKDEATFTRLVGCYVNGSKEKVHTFSTKFLTLEEAEYYKYLEIANKSLSGKLENNLLNLSFPTEEEEKGGRQHILMALRDSRLEDEALLETFYDLVIDTYDEAGNYLILLYHDAYDVITKASDNASLDESEEVYEYLICSICPVALSKPGLGFLEAENRIGSRIRDWVVGVPDTAFVFPAFNDRSADVHSALFYTKNVKVPHSEFMANGLGCGVVRTATEQKMAFHSIVRSVLGAEEETEDILLDIQQNLNYMVEEHKENSSDEDKTLVLDAATISKVLDESNVTQNNIQKIQNALDDAFGKEIPSAENVIDEKALLQNELRMEKIELQQEVAVLHKQLDAKQSEINAHTNNLGSNEIVVYLADNKVLEITTETVNGKKCLVIPVEEETVVINGEKR